MKILYFRVAIFSYIFLFCLVGQKYINGTQHVLIQLSRLKCMLLFWGGGSLVRAEAYEMVHVMILKVTLTKADGQFHSYPVRLSAAIMSPRKCLMHTKNTLVRCYSTYLVLM